MLNTPSISSYERCSSPISSLWSYARLTPESLHLSCASCSLRSPRTGHSTPAVSTSAQERGRITPLTLCSGSTLCLLWGHWPGLIVANLQAGKELLLLLVFTILGVSIPKPSKHILCLPLLWHSSSALWHRWLPTHIYCRQGAHLPLTQPQQEAWRKESSLRS